VRSTGARNGRKCMKHGYLKKPGRGSRSHAVQYIVAITALRSHEGVRLCDILFTGAKGSRCISKYQPLSRKSKSSRTEGLG